MADAVKKISSLEIRNRKNAGEKLVVMTAYDYTFATLIDEYVDIVLVGDSLGMVIQGESNTLSVTVDDIIYHTRAVAKGLRRAHLVADMPFLSYQTGERDAILNAGRLLAEGKAEAVKLEGGVAVAKIIEKLVDFGIPVMGHIGLTPQSVHAFGGFKVQGRTEAARAAIVNDAIALEDAGVYSMVLEGIPADLAAEITQRVKVPTIGIGAGSTCDGQVLVSQDALGLNTDFRPKFVKAYADLAGQVREAVHQYANEVRSGKFPGEEHSF
jgi:3-methyl-2-oxobutanoate hydroxymethyltransferase